MNNAKYRLGLDIGTNSIGWAAVKTDSNNNPCNLLDLGVRIFPDGRSDETGEISNAATRRTARGQRRRRDRYLQRRNTLLATLTTYGLMPAAEKDRKNLETLNPYTLRLRALDEPLTPPELARALFHLNQRRGFKSNRKAPGNNEKEDGKIRADINQLRQRITQTNSRTLGEYLAQRDKKKQPTRARPQQGLYPDRTMYETEFDAIRAAQEPHQSLNTAQWNTLRQTIFNQRPLRPVEPGWCQFEYENGERRAAKALPLFQEYRMLQEVNNLRLRVGLEPERPLDENQRAAAMRRLRQGKDITLLKPTKDLKLPPNAAFNLASGGRKTLTGDDATARLSKPELFGKKWLSLPLNERNSIVKFLLDTQEPEAVSAKATAEWNLNPQQAEAVSNVTLPPGYGNLSEKAIRKMLPHLEQGLTYSGAVQAAGYPHHSDFRNSEAQETLPYYGQALPRDAIGADPKKDPAQHGEPARYGRIANPTAHIGLNQLRRLVNKLIQTYGKPDEIVVELARELKSNRQQKEQYEKQQKTGRERNHRFRQQLESAEIPVTADTLLKLRLCEEQKYICPYTGTTLSLAMVMSNQTEVDHILPFSRTLDDSTANKVVSLTTANRIKGNRTPHEAFGHNPPNYNYNRILETTAHFPNNKLWRFQKDAMDRFEQDQDFLARQLNETRYLSRTARTYLASLYNEKGEARQRVRVIPGRMTALLRRSWGLAGMLNQPPQGQSPRKTRDDHRHHAIDAFVVANTTQALLQQFAQAAASNHRQAAEKLSQSVPPPWDGFDPNQVQKFLDKDKMIVSYKPDHGTRGVNGQTTGQLHDETAYRLLEAEGKYKLLTRKNLSGIKNRNSLNAVTDETLRKALLALWDETGGNPKFAAHSESQGVLLNGRRQQVRRVRVTTKIQQVITIRHQDSQGKVHQKHYQPGSNEFADIWQMPDGKWQTVVVPTFHANQPGFDLANYRPHPAAKKLMRLQKNDLGAFGEGPNRRIVRIRKMSHSAKETLIWMDEHNEANAAARIKKKELPESKYSARQLKAQGFRKVHVDELGQVRDRGPYRP